MRLSEKDTLEFVRIYLGYELLWNPEDVDYKQQHKRKKAYHDIKAEFKAATNIVLDVAEVKSKIKNLRSTYTLELDKIRQRSTPGLAYKPAMKWFPQWHKCFNNIVKRRNVTGTESDIQETEDLCKEIWLSEPTINETEDSEETNPFVSQTEDSYEHIFKVEPRESRRRSSDSFESKRKIKRKRLSIDFSDAYRRSEESNSQPKEDEFDIYGKYIASQLRNMDLEKAIRVQLDIQSIVSEARISCLNNN